MQVSKAEERRCAVCGALFRPARSNQVCCSDKCKSERYKLLIEARRQKEVQERRAALAERQCAICGKTFAPVRRNQVCCCADCAWTKKARDLAYSPERYQRKKQERLASEADRAAWLAQIEKRLEECERLLAELAALCRVRQWDRIAELLGEMECAGR